MRRMAAALALAASLALAAPGLAGVARAQVRPVGGAHGAGTPGEEAEAPEGGHAEGEAAHEHYHPLDTGALFVQVLGFAILFGVLAYFAFPPAAEALGRRRERIRKTFEDLERERGAAERAKRDAETQLQQAERSSLERMEQAVREGVRLREELVAEGTALADQVHRKSQVEAAIERAKLSIELRNEVVALGFDAAEEVIRASMTDEVQAALVASFLDGLDGLSARGGKRAS